MKRDHTMNRPALFLLLLAGLSLSACGMNRAVGVLPNTLDDLAAKSQGTGSQSKADWPRGRIKP